MKQIVIGQPVVNWVARELKREEGYAHAVGIGIERDGELIAGVVYESYNTVNINMHVAAVGRDWMTRHYLWACFDYPFNQCKVRRITGFVEETNSDAIRFDVHLGFKYETRLKDACANGDYLIFVMRREDCRWLNIRRHPPLQLLAA